MDTILTDIPDGHARLVHLTHHFLAPSIKKYGLLFNAHISQTTHGFATNEQVLAYLVKSKEVPPAIGMLFKVGVIGIIIDVPVSIHRVLDRLTVDKPQLAGDVPEHLLEKEYVAPCFISHIVLPNVDGSLHVQKVNDFADPTVIAAQDAFSDLVHVALKIFLIRKDTPNFANVVPMTTGNTAENPNIW